MIAATPLHLAAKPPRIHPARPKPTLRAWMERVLVECDRAAAGFDADPVHDPRVALRRCRSLADGMIAIDPDPSWKAMKKSGKKLFQGLGELRDMQVMEEWIEKLVGMDLSPSDRPVRSASAQPISRQPLATGMIGETKSGDAFDPVVAQLLAHIQAREIHCKQLARKELNQFDRKQWRQWSRTLPQRSARIRPGSPICAHLALEKWTAAYELHKRALRSKSQTSWHDLRIGIKRLRYTVENFLPAQHALWGSDLKDLQDVLGDVHDLDVLWATALAIHAFPDAQARMRWRQKLNVARARRIDRYRTLMVGRQSLWHVWRAQLPSGPALRASAIGRLRVWAGYLDPDSAHSQRVAKLALLLYDGLRSAGLLTLKPLPAGMELPNSVAPTREVLQAAAFMHDVGKAKGLDNHQKLSYRMIRELARPLGWSARDLELAAVVARYHRGRLPHPNAKSLLPLQLPDRSLAIELAGVLRLANALDFDRPHSNRPRGNAPPIEVRLQDGCVLLLAAGYSALDASAENVAAARHLLETVLRKPILVRTLRSTAHDPRKKLRITTGRIPSNVRRTN